jgi:opacity protein-like surface antigen
MRRLPVLGDIGRVLCVVALLWLAPVVFSPEAHAGKGSGLYLAADLGMVLSSTSDFKSAIARGQTDFDSGLGYSAAVGLGWGGLRMEGEASWRRSDLDAIEYDQFSVDGRTLPSTVVDAINDNIKVKGTRSTLDLMANAWYDLDVGAGFMPYFGGGLGVQYVRYDIDLPLDPLRIPGLPSGAANVLSGLGGDDGDWVLAYQVGAGVGYRVMESLVVHVGYRYMGAGDPKLNWIPGSAVKSEAGNHVFRAGVRIGF